MWAGAERSRACRLWRGFSLIEAMIALLVLSIGLGGVAMQMYSAVGGTSDAQRRSLAALHAASLATIVRLGVGIEPGGWLTMESAHDNDLLAQWRLRLARDVPGASAAVCFDASPLDGDRADALCDGKGLLVVKIFWLDSRRQFAVDQGKRRLFLPLW